jgi:hypothetical protein
MRRSRYRPDLRGAVRRKLLHIIDNCNICGTSMFMHDLIRCMPQYAHTVVVLDDPESADQPLVWYLQAAGVNLLFSVKYDCTYLSNQHSAAILHSLYRSDYKLPSDIPIVYHAYGNYDPAIAYDVLLIASDNMATTYGIDVDYEVLPPGVCTRVISSNKPANTRQFTYGVFSSTAPGKYPLELVKYLMPRVPDGARLLVTGNKSLPKPPPGRKVWMVPQMVGATIKGIQLSDVVLYASQNEYTTPYGRTCVEAMSARRPVVCQRNGAPASSLTDGIHALMFDTPSEALEKVLYLRDNPENGEILAANGQLWASWQDINTHVGTFRSILKALGA